MIIERTVATTMALDIRNNRVMLLACFITADMINPITAYQTEKFTIKQIASQKFPNMIRSKNQNISNEAV
jgi:hypothetical protein